VTAASTRPTRQPRSELQDASGAVKANLSTPGLSVAPGVVVALKSGSQRLIVDGFPSTAVARVLSPNGGRAHWRQREACQKIVEANVSAACVIQKIQPMTGRVVIYPTFVYPVHRRRDDDNLATGVMKSVRDTLVKRGILADDSVEYVRQEPAQVRIEKGQRRLEIVLEPLARTGDSEGV
jgi:Holliday junction resolvase RusA-like endonuclease